MNLTDSITDFLIAQEADGSSAATLRWYKSLLGKFSAYVGGDVELAEVSTAAIRAYIIDCRKRYAEDTAHAHVRAQHKFWRWCSVEYGIPSPMRNIKYPSQPKPSAPKAASSSDIEKLLQSITTSNPIGIRDRSLFAFLVDTGSRAGGVCTLAAANLDIERRRAVVVEKGRKQRAVSFDAITAEWLAAWLDVRSPVETVFYNMRTLRPLTVSGVGQLMTRLKSAAGVKGRVNPHSFRHAFAREYLRSGGDLATLSRILGHANIKTTAEYYAVFTQDEITAAHAKHSPMKRLLDKKERGG